MDSVHTITANFDIDLHPSKTEDVLDGIREQLNAGLLRFNEDLEGVVLSYSKERIVSKQAVIRPYFPYLHVKVCADVVLFKPQVGALLVGQVNKVGSDYLGLLVLGIFNVSIGVSGMPDFRCDAQEQCWYQSRDLSHRIALGSDVRFSVVSLLDQGSLFSIVGSLVDPQSGEVNYMSRSKAARVKSKKAKKGGHSVTPSGAGPAGEGPDRVADARQQQQGASPSGAEHGEDEQNPRLNNHATAHGVNGGSSGKKKKKRKAEADGGAPAAAQPAAKKLKSVDASEASNHKKQRKHHQHKQKDAPH